MDSFEGLRLNRESNFGEPWAGLLPGQGCIDRIFILRQSLQTRRTYRHPMIVAFLDLKGAFV